MVYNFTLLLKYVSSCYQYNLRHYISMYLILIWNTISRIIWILLNNNTHKYISTIKVILSFARTYSSVAHFRKTFSGLQKPKDTVKIYLLWRLHWYYCALLQSQALSNTLVMPDDFAQSKMWNDGGTKYTTNIGIVKISFREYRLYFWHYNINTRVIFSTTGHSFVIVFVVVMKSPRCLFTRLHSVQTLHVLYWFFRLAG